MKQRITGTIVSTKMQETAIVLVQTTIVNRKYNKQLKRSRRFYADNPGNKALEGNIVEIEECQPLSKTKRWRIVNILK